MWTFLSPTKTTFGPGASRAAHETAKTYGAPAVLVTDAKVSGVPAVQRVLEAFGDGPVFYDVRPNPTTENVDALTALLRRERARVVVAIGGGSVMDCAKAAACLAKTDRDHIRPFHSENLPLPSDAIPLIAMPTTAGTGAEVTPFAVLDDRENGIKAPLAGAALYPTCAVADPELTYSMPRAVTASTGLDALAHAIEGYWSINHQPICDLLAKEAARLIFIHLETALREPENAPARDAMSYTALLAGMAFQLPKNAIVHAASFPLSNRYHLSHGAACAFLLESAIKLNAPYMDGRMQAFAAACGFDALDAMCARIGEFKALGGLPRTLADAGIDPADVPRIIRESFHPLVKNNPKPVTEEDLQQIYAALA